LRSGDAVYMSGEARFAWHGVAKIVPGTCPDYLSDWPGKDFPDWKNWMRNKRINLNVRQMRE
jgi:alkylated DNA repair protein alkB family protein 1